MPFDIDILPISPQWKPVWGQAEKRARHIVGFTLEYIGLRRAPLSLSVALSGDAHMRELNRDYRGKDRPTNVLSFPGYEGAFEQAFARRGKDAFYLGDIALACETLRREAREQGKRFEDHAAHMLVHGTLHLCGFDHHADGEAACMEMFEIQILKSLGIANPYML
jgi:probable rRNA maturation factor